jgi:membrane protease YdiL (CAAX protease family)
MASDGCLSPMEARSQPGSSCWRSPWGVVLNWQLDCSFYVAKDTKCRWIRYEIVSVSAGQKVVLFLGMSLSMAMGPVNRTLASTPGFMPPHWWPAANNPTVEVHGAADYFPDVNLVGNYPFVLVYFVIGLVFNIFGEEIYYRGYLLPRMRGAFGRWDWVANGVLFTLKHAYQRWLYPGILVGGLCFAFAAGPLGSLPLAMAYHWVGNFLFQMVFLTRAAMGVG